MHKLRDVLLVPVCALFLALVPAALASDEGQAAADEVSQAVYYDLMDNWLYTHTGDDRGYGPEHDLARDNIAYLMESYGLTVTLEPFTYSSTTYYNVVGTKIGVTYPDQEYVLGGHYDSVSNPGADDNASGVALVLEAARIICQYDSDYTIRFIAFDREEQGLIGSAAYVSDHSGDDILGMVCADMVAYDPGTNHALLYGVNPFKAGLGAAILEYGDGLTYTDDGWIGASDHASFNDAGIPNVLLIEGEVWNNPYYHTQQDNFENPNNLNFPYAVKMTRSVVGYMVDLAGVQVPIDALVFTYPEGRPEFINPLGGTRMRVEVAGVGAAVPQPGTGVLHYNTGSGWDSVAMDVVSDNVYDAVFPAATCPDEVLYYVSAETTGSAVFTDPRQAPTVTYSAVAGYGVEVVFADDFETDQGWTLVNGADTGNWERVVPSGSGGGRGDPPSDYDGSGRCYVTGNGYDEDLDGGPVVLTSPLLDLSAGDNYSVSYARWFYNDDGDDVLTVEITNNDGSSWFTVETASGSGGWVEHAFNVADYVTPTALVRVRFTTSDNPNDSVTEAGVDAFQVYSTICDPEFERGDLNCDGYINGFDIDAFVLAVGGDLTEYYNLYPDCDHALADVNSDGEVNGFDIDPFIALVGGG